MQIHAIETDPIFVGEGDIAAARNLIAQTTHGELFLYPGDQHLFVDSSLPAYDAGATALLLNRVLAFLAAIEHAACASSATAKRANHPIRSKISISVTMSRLQKVQLGGRRIMFCRGGGFVAETIKSSNSNRPLVLIGLLVTQLLALVSILLIWLPGAFIAVVAENPEGTVPLWLIAFYGYPIYPLAMSIGAWVAYARRNDKLAAILAALLLPPILLFVVVIFLNW